MKSLFTKTTTLFALLLITTTFVSAQEKIGQLWTEWANFKRYEDQNKKTPAPAKGERRVVFLGNSIFEGWLTLRPEFFDKKPYYNRGISGQTTPQMLLRFYEDVVALNPEVLVLKAGINDIAENTGPYDQLKTLNNLIAIAQLARANKIKVIICSVLPVSDFPWRRGLAPGDKVIALNNEIKKFAAANKFYYLDLYSFVVDNNKGMKSEYASDGVHPTAAGYKIMEPLLEEAIGRVSR